MIYERAKLPRTQLVATDVIKIGTLPSCHVQLSHRRVAKVHAIIEVRSPAVHTGVRTDEQRALGAKLRRGRVRGVRAETTRIVPGRSHNTWVPRRLVGESHRT